MSGELTLLAVFEGPMAPGRTPRSDCKKVSRGKHRTEGTYERRTYPACFFWAADGLRLDSTLWL